MSTLKLMLIINIFLSFLYAYSSLGLWYTVNQWSNWYIASNWSPIFITPRFVPSLPMVQTPIPRLWNSPFILFWVILAVNLYFIIKLQGSKETKPNPS
jgi:hypothetical protein